VSGAKRLGSPAARASSVGRHRIRIHIVSDFRQLAAGSYLHGDGSEHDAPKIARGVIAVGNIAVGAIAVDGIACGLFTLGARQSEFCVRSAVPRWDLGSR